MKKIFIIAVAILFLSPNVFARWDDDSGGGSPFTSLQAENIGDVTPGDGTFTNLVVTGTGEQVSLDSNLLQFSTAGIVSINVLGNNGGIRVYTENKHMAEFNSEQDLELLLGKLKVLSDNDGVTFGAAQDASIYYDGSDMVIDPDAVGTGSMWVKGNATFDGMVIADEYKSSDGTSGMTGSCADGTALTVKDGLVTACS